MYTAFVVTHELGLSVPGLDMFLETPAKPLGGCMWGPEADTAHARGSEGQTRVVRDQIQHQKTQVQLLLNSQLNV